MDTGPDQELYALALRLGQALKGRGASLATAESCTGGWIGQVVTMIPGSSAWFERGYITYSNDAKTSELGVTASILERHGAVSEPVVIAMVEGALRRSGANLAVAVSGVAGPGGGTAAKPVGMVCIAWGSDDGVRGARTLHFAGARHSVRRQTVIAALEAVLVLVESPAVA